MMNEFRICPVCKYKRGFHSSFKKEKNKIKVIFICPNCGSSFDLGITEDRITNIVPKKGETYGE
jgi:transcription elongation factor Elf1